MKTQYKNFISKVNQTGSLMIEAMAMLALISLVTPTLYKKSAERTTELQDINTATHVRTIMKAVDNYVTANYQSLLDNKLRNDGSVYEIDLNDDSSEDSIHDFFPYGYKFDDLKNFGMPKVMLKRQGFSITSFVQLPKKTDIGEMRAARIASMIGSNGGYVNSDKNALGVGGVWSLNQVDLTSLGFDTNKGSVVVASSDAINSASTGALENDKYLQRTPVDRPDQLWRNTMITDLYMGGVTGVDDMYKILGVDQLIMGSTDKTNNLETLVLTDAAQGGGSAWMAGTLSALNNAFKIDGSSEMPILTLADEEGTIMSADSRTFDLFPEADGTVGLEVNQQGQNIISDYATTINNDLTATGDTLVASGGTDTSFKAGPDGRYITADASKVLLQNGQVEILDDDGTGAVTNIKGRANITGITTVGTTINPGANSMEGLIPDYQFKVYGTGNAYVANDLVVGNTLYTKKFNTAELHAGGEMLAGDDARWLHATATGVRVTDPTDSANVRTRMEITENRTALYNQDGRNSGGGEMVLDQGSSRLTGKDMVEMYTNADNGEVQLQNNALVIRGKTEASGGRNAVISADADTVDLNANITSVNDGVFQVRREDNAAGMQNSLYVNPNENTNQGLVLAEANRTTVRPRGTDGIFDVQDEDGKRVLNVMPNGLNGETVNVGYNSYTRPIGTVDVDKESVSFSDVTGNSAYRVVEVDLDRSLAQKTDDDNPTRGSVYIRRGAVELESPSGAGYEADAGYGYIEAGRFVANTKYNGVDIDNPKNAYTSDYSSWGINADDDYDRYMVNPAYTSVMHDIKLTTRGGARLSDILPDFINKGIYVVNNTYKDTGFSLNSITATASNGGQISVSVNNCSESASKCIDEVGSGTLSNENQWASPFLGVVPAPLCPPGHARVITITPAGFQMSQAGQMIKSKHYVGAKSNKKGNRFVVDERASLNELGLVNNMDMADDNQTITGAQYQHSTITDSAGNTRDLYYLGYGNEPTLTKTQGSGTTTYAPQPLYFQQSTWLKSKVQPQNNGQAGSCNESLGSGEGCKDFVGWSAIMGFIYPASLYDNIISAVVGNPPKDEDVYWNVFPVKAKTLEAYATVYCYFDRTNLYNSGMQDEYTDKYDQLNSFRTGRTKPTNSYTERLDDPTLKYKNPW